MLIKLLLRKLIRSTYFSLHGLRFAFFEDQAFRMEALMSIIIIPLALWLGKTPYAKAILLCSWLFVLLVELLNSAIEMAINRISFERHPLSRRAKDMGSAAVMLAGSIWFIIWCVVLYN